MPSAKAERRSTAGDSRRRRLLLLVTEYQKLQHDYPDLRDEIQVDIDEHLRAAARTRETDRRSVVKALEEWRDAGLVGAAVDELSEETGLSGTTVRRILSDFMAEEPPRAGFVERETDRDRGRQTRYYFLTENK